MEIVGEKIFKHFEFLQSRSFDKYFKINGQSLYALIITNADSIKVRYKDQDYSSVLIWVGSEIEQFTKSLYNVAPRIREMGHISQDEWYESSQAQRIRKLIELRIIDRNIGSFFNDIRKVRNDAIHNEKKAVRIDKSLALNHVKKLHDVLAYFYNAYFVNYKQQREIYASSDLNYNLKDMPARRRCHQNVKNKYNIRRQYHNVNNNLENSSNKNSYENKTSQKNAASNKKSTAPKLIKQDYRKYIHTSKNNFNNENAEWNDTQNNHEKDMRPSSARRRKPKHIWVIVALAVACLCVFNAVFHNSGSNSSLTSDKSISNNTSSIKKDIDNPAGKAFRIDVRVESAQTTENGNDEIIDLTLPELSNNSIYLVFKSKSKFLVINNEVDMREALASKRSFDNMYKLQRVKGTYSYKQHGLTLHHLALPWKYQPEYSNSLQLTSTAQQKFEETVEAKAQKIDMTQPAPTATMKIEFFPQDFINTNGKTYRGIYTLNFIMFKLNE